MSIFLLRGLFGFPDMLCSEEQEAELANDWAQLRYTENRRSMEWRKANKMLSLSLGNARPAEEKCLKIFISNA